MDYLGLVSEESPCLNAFAELPREVMYFAVKVNCILLCYHDGNDVLV